MNNIFSFFISLLFFLSSCSSKSTENEIKVAATPIPHAEILQQIQSDLKAQGFDLNIIITEDYHLPNRALADGEVDANFFQHLPFMEEQIRQFHYPISSLGPIEIEPMGIYSTRLADLADLRDSASIAIPNDPANEARALLLLQESGLITLDNPANLQATIFNIVDNPKRLVLMEVDAAMLPRVLRDVDVAVINTNYALAAQLSPLQDALLLENENSPYANILTIRVGDEKKPKIQALFSALTSTKMRKFILEKYQGAILPTF